jgi:sensor histidine kinase YesM
MINNRTLLFLVVVLSMSAAITSAVSVNGFWTYQRQIQSLSERLDRLEKGTANSELVDGDTASQTLNDTRNELKSLLKRLTQDELALQEQIDRLESIGVTTEPRN